MVKETTDGVSNERTQGCSWVNLWEQDTPAKKFIIAQDTWANSQRKICLPVQEDEQSLSTVMPDLDRAAYLAPKPLPPWPIPSRFHSLPFSITFTARSHQLSSSNRHSIRDQTMCCLSILCFSSEDCIKCILRPIEAHDLLSLTCYSSATLTK